jgi:hypothetical protein
LTAAIFLATFAVLAAGRAPLLRIDRPAPRSSARC